jgi:GNAT superfamily N-acetyltransferase
MTLSDLSLSGGETMVEIDFNALSLDESSFVYRQHAFSIHRIPHSDPGYWEYELTLDETPVGRAVCQPSSLIQQHLTTPQSAALYIDPILIHLYGGHCHWIETIQILPPSRGQGYGSVWLESLCALLQSEAKLPIALYPDEWWDDSTPLQGHHLDQWYERHGFLKFPGTDSFMKLRVRDDGDRTVTLERIQTMMAEVAASLHNL